ncbi:MAG: hypothetical protein WDW36_003287 [Sanguina aurantia]
MVPVPLPATAALVKGPPKAVSTTKAANSSLPALPRADLEPQQFMEALMSRLMGLDRERFFQQPVDESIAPNYNSIITAPMCFSIMQQRTVDKQYASWRAFCDDFELICTNAKLYNTNKTLVHKAAAALQKKGHTLIAGHDMELRKALGLLHPDAHLKAGLSTSVATAAAPQQHLPHPAPHPALPARGQSTDALLPGAVSSGTLAGDGAEAMQAGAVSHPEGTIGMETSNPVSPRAHGLQRQPTDALPHATMPELNSLHSSAPQALPSTTAPTLAGTTTEQAGTLRPHTRLQQPLCPYISDTEEEEHHPPIDQQPGNTGSEQLQRLLTSQPLNSLLQHLRTTSLRMPYLNQPCHMSHHRRRPRASAAATAPLHQAGILVPSTEQPALNSVPPLSSPAAAMGTPSITAATGPTLPGDNSFKLAPELGVPSSSASAGPSAAAAAGAVAAAEPLSASAQDPRLVSSCQASQIAWQCSWLELRMQELAEQQHRLEGKLQLLTSSTSTTMTGATEPVIDPSAMEEDAPPTATHPAVVALSHASLPAPAEPGAGQPPPSPSPPPHPHAGLPSPASALPQPGVLHTCLALRSMAAASASALPPTPASLPHTSTPTPRHSTQPATALLHQQGGPTLTLRQVSLHLPPLRQRQTNSSSSSLSNTSCHSDAHHSHSHSHSAAERPPPPADPASTALVFPALEQLERQVGTVRARLQHGFKLELGRGLVHRQPGMGRSAPVTHTGYHLGGGSSAGRLEGNTTAGLSKKQAAGMQRTMSAAGGAAGLGLTVLTRVESGTKRKRDPLDEAGIPLLSVAGSLMGGSVVPIHMPKVRELSELECAARHMASTGWLAAVLLDPPGEGLMPDHSASLVPRRGATVTAPPSVALAVSTPALQAHSLTNVPPEVAAVLREDEGSSSEDTSDEAFEARHAFMEAEEHKRYSLVVADKRRSISSGNVALSGKSAPGLKTPRGQRLEDQPFSPSSTFDAIAAAMATGAPGRAVPLTPHARVAPPPHLTQHQQHIAAAQQHHLIAAQQQQQQQLQQSLAVAPSGGPKASLQRTVSKTAATPLPRSSDSSTPSVSAAAHTSAAAGTPTALDSRHLAPPHHPLAQHQNSAGAQHFTAPVPHRAPHMLRPPALMYTQPAASSTPAATHPLTGGGSPHPAAGAVSVAAHTPELASGGGGRDGEASGASGAASSDADDGEGEAALDDDDADVELADLEDESAAARRRTAAGSKKGKGKAPHAAGSSPSGRPRGSGSGAGMPRRSSGSVTGLHASGAAGAGAATRGRDGQ